MIIALDSNEYINFLNQKPLILNGILENEKIAIFINEIIVKEVLRHVKETIKKDFYKLLFADNINVPAAIIDFDAEFPAGIAKSCFGYKCNIAHKFMLFFFQYLLYLVLF